MASPRHAVPSLIAVAATALLSGCLHGSVRYLELDECGYLPEPGLLSMPSSAQYVEPVSYRTDFGDGAVTAFGPAIPADHRYSTSGTYLVTVTMKDAKGEITRHCRITVP